MTQECLSGEEKAFRNECRIKAISIARDMKPPSQYVNGQLGIQHIEPKYDIVLEAERIYQWLIKE